jgi:hypothetical protein
VSSRYRDRGSPPAAPSGAPCAGDTVVLSCERLAGRSPVDVPDVRPPRHLASLRQLYGTTILNLSDSRSSARLSPGIRSGAGYESGAQLLARPERVGRRPGSWSPGHRQRVPGRPEHPVGCDRHQARRGNPMVSAARGVCGVCANPATVTDWTPLHAWIAVEGCPCGGFFIRKNALGGPTFGDGADGVPGARRARSGMAGSGRRRLDLHYGRYAPCAPLRLVR